MLFSPWRFPAAAAALLVAAGCTCGGPRAPSVCDSLARYQAAFTARAAACGSLDGGLRVDSGGASPATCAASENTCTESDRLAVVAGATCAESYAACDPADGGAFLWAFGFTLACGTQLAAVSAPCNEAVADE